MAPYCETDCPVREEIQPAPHPSTPAPNSAPNRPGMASWKRPLHQPNTGEDEAAQADHCARIQSEGLEGVHHIGSAAHVDTALSVGHTGYGESEGEWGGGTGHHSGLFFDLLGGDGQAAKTSKTGSEELIQGGFSCASLVDKLRWLS